jgi:hypothetical protein
MNAFDLKAALLAKQAQHSVPFLVLKETDSITSKVSRKIA